MDVSIIGASGDCGREIAIQLVAERVLSPTERLQLVGRRGGRSERVLFGLRSDLADAYAEIAPELDVALHPEEVVGDIIVMAAGQAVPIDASSAPSRDTLAHTNLPVFHTYARALEKYGHGNEVVIVVTNPVELGVEIFSRYLGRHRVIGIGAYSDSLRFRREIAADVGVRRQMVHAFVVGEHGEQMVPLWSSVRIYGMDMEEMLAISGRLRGNRSVLDFPQEVQREKLSVVAYLQQGLIREAFEHVDRLPPDLRVVLKPYLTHLSGAKTAVATANVTVDLVRTLMDGREIVVAGQVRLDGEFYGIHTTIGAPIVAGNNGWSQVVPLQLWEDEARLLMQSASRIQRKLREWTKHGE
ncbi:MAG: malate dehydrogenase [Armatimonadota bacterium]|nr:MAG: malate dehydrogenase [Armatimonadota bacterium]